MFWLKSSRSPTLTSRDRETSPPCAPWWRSPGCCAQPLTTVQPLCQKCQDADQHAAAAHEKHSAPDIFGRREASVAEHGPFPQHPAVGVGATEPDTEGAGERGLGHAGVGAGGERTVAKGAQERTKGPTRDRRDGEHRKARGRQVGEIVKTGSGPSEVSIGRLPVAYHRVHGIHGLVRQRIESVVEIRAVPIIHFSPAGRVPRIWRVAMKIREGKARASTMPARRLDSGPFSPSALFSKAEITRPIQTVGCTDSGGSPNTPSRSSAPAICVPCLHLIPCGEPRGAFRPRVRDGRGAPRPARPPSREGPRAGRS